MRSLTRIPAVTALSLLACVVALTAQSRPSAPLSQDARLKWFRESKFGLMIHWGLYAIPAGEWKGHLIPGPGEWIMHEARIPVREYEHLASQFRPAQFDAEEWAKFAVEAGMKYIVVTAKDHDGFAMYRSTVSKYNVFDGTPFHRDPLKELAAACARHNLKLGIYYSEAIDWHEPSGLGNTWDFGADEKKDFDKYLRDKAEPQVKELLTGYGPVGLIWFDAPSTMNRARAQRFIDLVHSLQPATLINGRPGSGGDYQSMEADRIPDAVLNDSWEVPATLNHTMGFKRDDNVWKSSDELIFNLVDIVSKGGNYLVNVGPTAEGIIPRPSLVTLETVGAWLKANGEAIYGAGPTAFGNQSGRPAGAPPLKWRCTTGQGKLFLTLFQWPEGPLELDGVKGKVGSAYFLTSHSPLKFVQTGGRVAVTMPKDPPLEGGLPDRMNPKFAVSAARAHVHTVVVLETASK